MKKHTKKLMATKKKTINNTTEKEGGFDSPEVTPKEKNITKESLKTQGKAPRN
jgi:hypothetical protein